VDFLKQLAERLKARGYLYIVSDWEDYAAEIRQTIEAMPEWIPSSALAPWRPETAFEKKGRGAGRQIHEILVTKNTAETHNL
jgi:tRNA (guanine-N7-)-methyltransferase